MKALNKEVLNNANNLRASAKDKEDEISDRIDHILHRLFDIFNLRLKYWYFSGAEENSVGDVLANICDERISDIVVSFGAGSERNIKFIDKFGKLFTYSGTLPTRWLFDDDFESEILNGIKKLEELNKKKKRKDLLKKKRILLKDQN